MEQGMDHKLTLLAREKLCLTGVTEVVSFTDTAVVLNTNLGTLIVQGQNLKLELLSLEGGQTEVTGRVSALVYEEMRTGGWLSRLLG